jgi:hypothetical protein
VRGTGEVDGHDGDDGDIGGEVAHLVVDLVHG